MCYSRTHHCLHDVSARAHQAYAGGGPPCERAGGSADQTPAAASTAGPLSPPNVTKQCNFSTACWISQLRYDKRRAEGNPYYDQAGKQCNNALLHPQPHDIRHCSFACRLRAAEKEQTLLLEPACVAPRKLKPDMHWPGLKKLAHSGSPCSARPAATAPLPDAPLIHWAPPSHATSAALSHRHHRPQPPVLFTYTSWYTCGRKSIARATCAPLTLSQKSSSHTSPLHYWGEFTYGILSM